MLEVLTGNESFAVTLNLVHITTVAVILNEQDLSQTRNSSTIE